MKSSKVVNGHADVIPAVIVTRTQMMSFSAALFFLAQAVAPSAGATPAPTAAAPQLPTKAQMDEEVKKNFAKIDLNHDGRVDRDESAKANAAALAAREANAFSQLDANKDGMISREEFKVVIPPWARKDVWFEANDIDRNGVVELNEAIAKAERNFERLDADNNGSISPEELRPQRQRNRRQ
jgi:Ca2+-binding EF-hand superfamily protein